MKKSSTVVGMVLAITLAAGAASAATIGPGCPTCFGNIFTLSTSPVSLGSPFSAYLVTLTMNTAGFVPVGSPEWLESVSAKVCDEADLVAVTVVSDPAGWIGSLSMPSDFFTGTNMGGTPFGLPDGSPTWSWEVVMKGVPVSLAVKATYQWRDPASGMLETRETSEVFGAQPAVPEPASLLLFGTGLAGLRAWRKRG